jgi:antitoxin YefM
VWLPIAELYNSIVRMAVEASYSYARANLAKLLDRVVDDAETVFVRRRNGKDVAIIAADELERLSAAAYLLASPRNRRRLLAALRQSRAGRGRRMTVGELRQEIGL